MQQASKFAMHLSFVRLKLRKNLHHQGCSVFFVLLVQCLLALLIQL